MTWKTNVRSAQFLCLISNLLLLPFVPFSHAAENLSPPSNPSDSSQRRIIGGQNTVYNTWHNMLSLQNGFGHSCGASLIHPYWVLTAAHCVDRYVGTFNPFLYILSGLNGDPEQQQLIQVKRFIQHPDWDTFNIDSPNDIALLELSEPSLITPMRLTLDDATAHTSTFGKALGWGVTNLISNSSAQVLQEVTLPIVSNAVCQDAYEGIYELSEQQFCAGFPEGGKDTCFGDSGGPFLTQDANGDWRQMGIISYGGDPDDVPCAGADAYGIYMKVADYLDFIQTNTFSALELQMQDSYHTMDTLQIYIKETDIESHPRTEVDLWVVFIIDGQLFFLQGEANAPKFATEIIPWRQNVLPAEQQHLMLDIPLSAELVGEYPFIVFYSRAGEPLSFDVQQSNILNGTVRVKKK